MEVLAGFAVGCFRVGKAVTGSKPLVSKIVVEVNDVVVLSLVGFETALDQIHAAGDKQRERCDDDVDRDIIFHHQIVQTRHDENREIFVEILYGD